MAKKGRSNKKKPSGRPQAAKRPIAAGPVRTRPAPSSSGAAQAAPAPPAASRSGGTGKPSQAERFEAARRARRAKQLRVRLTIGAVPVLLIGLIAFNALSNRSDDSAFRQQLTAGTCNFDTRKDSLSAPPNNHVAPPGYKVNPPAGGNHDPSAAPAGTFEQASAPPDANVVHSLEHGYIAIWHRPGLPEKDMDAITKVADRYVDDILVLPRPSLPPGVKVAATAWGERLLCKNVELRPLTDFAKKYRNQGPEKVPHT